MRTSLRRAPARVRINGAASAALRAPLDFPRRPGRVLAAFSLGVYVEVRAEAEPYVIAVLDSAATRLPNAVVIGGGTAITADVGDEAAVGDGRLLVGDAEIRVRRWWDPAPVVAPVAPARLAAAIEIMAAVCDRSPRRPGLGDHSSALRLAAACAGDDLLGATVAAEELVGLGPGLTPSGDDMLAGLLLGLRALGRAAGAPRAARLADWLGAAVTFDARARTTAISATLLTCAARGESCAEAAAVLHAIPGRAPLLPALHRLLHVGHTSGADLAWGLLTAARAVRALA
ncbi:DUF2877 domain-containing protein [Bailinhaonella thermotolerans]|uniref:DUF2877 domain-containing protein n=1 Tax=Bailinhaonella thermotolerans TaxID=1070861 RepID=A0A3A4ARV2_9ACTN|nr:DUF2877 domain-containing protein [Bailinhaonella thermotolerans]RJL31329.1 DUF2877 domain-containing protein [Bailinhaonella thermotolerans]